MGYTHYMKDRTKVYSRVAWKKFREDFHLLYDKEFTGLIQHESNDDRSPFLYEDTISFNGIGDEGHETFAIYRDQWTAFDFCKTNRKPYDIAVQCCLLLAQIHFPGSFTLESDGVKIEWREASNLIKKYFGKDPQYDTKWAKRSIHKK